MGKFAEGAARLAAESGQQQSNVGQFMQGAKELLGAAYDVAQRPVMQGAAEVTQALFTGSAYVPYGEGQRSEEPQHGLPKEAQVEKQKDVGMEM